MKITLIDDDQISIFVTNRVLLKHATEKEISTFLSPIEALTGFSKLSNCGFPDLILLDLNMPKLNGFEFLDALYKQNEKFKSIKVCILTSSSNEEDKRKSNEYPSVIEFITKPLSVDRFEILNQKLLSINN